jgi:hypothetical protein
MFARACLLLSLAACSLPDAPDIADGTVSVSLATPGGVAHVVLACPRGDMLPRPPAAMPARGR